MHVGSIPTVRTTAELLKEKLVSSKAQRQNQYVRRLEAKIKRFKKHGKNTEGLEKELGYCMGDKRPAFNTGRDADPRFKKHRD